MVIENRSRDRSSTTEKKKEWVNSGARKKAEKERSLYFETARFACHFYGSCNQEERRVLDVVRVKMVDIYRDYNNKVFYPPKTSYKVSFNEDDVSAIINEFRPKVENELNYLLENMINVDTKQTIKDFIPDFKQGDITKHSHIWDYWSCIKFRDYDEIFPHNRNGRRKSKAKAPKLTHQQRDALVKLHLANQAIIAQEADHYRETSQVLKSFAHNQTVTYEERVSLQRASMNVIRVVADLEEESFGHRDVPLLIKEHRSKVEEELNYVCNNVSNATIIQDSRRLLADFQTGPKPSQIHHMTSGEGSSKPIPPYL